MASSTLLSLTLLPQYPQIQKTMPNQNFNQITLKIDLRGSFFNSSSSSPLSHASVVVSNAPEKQASVMAPNTAKKQASVEAQGNVVARWFKAVLHGFDLGICRSGNEKRRSEELNHKYNKYPRDLWHPHFDFPCRSMWKFEDRRSRGVPDDAMAFIHSIENNQIETTRN